MTSFGSLDRAINAEATWLQLESRTGSTNSTTAWDELITIFDIHESGPHPINTVTTRGGRVDFFSSPIREIRFKALVTRLVHERLKALSKLNDRFALPTQKCRMHGMAINKSSSSDESQYSLYDDSDDGADVKRTNEQFHDIIVPFIATFPEVTRLAGDSGASTIEVLMRIDNSSY